LKNEVINPVMLKHNKLYLLESENPTKTRTSQKLDKLVLFLTIACQIFGVQAQKFSEPYILTPVTPLHVTKQE